MRFAVSTEFLLEHASRIGFVLICIADVVRNEYIAPSWLDHGTVNTVDRVDDQVQPEIVADFANLRRWLDMTLCGFVELFTTLYCNEHCYGGVREVQFCAFVQPRDGDNKWVTLLWTHCVSHNIIADFLTAHRGGWWRILLIWTQACAICIWLGKTIIVKHN